MGIPGDFLYFSLSHCSTVVFFVISFLSDLSSIRWTKIGFEIKEKFLAFVTIVLSFDLKQRMVSALNKLLDDGAFVV